MAMPSESGDRRQDREILSRHFLLAHFEQDELDELLSYAKTLRYDPHQPIFFKGDPGNGLYAIKRGQVAISVVSADGKEILLNILEEGELFGEIALLDGRERTADATAMVQTELLYIDRRDFVPFLRRQPDVCIRLLTVLCNRLRHVSNIIEDAVFLDLPRRLAKRLLGFARMYGTDTGQGIEVGIRLSQHELGKLMGTSRESINKQLGQWREAGLIDVKRGRITLLRPADLEAMVEEM